MDDISVSDGRSKTITRLISETDPKLVAAETTSAVTPTGTALSSSAATLELDNAGTSTAPVITLAAATATFTAENTSPPEASYMPANSMTAVITHTIIGRSHENWPILAYQFGAGPDPVALVGGLHGGYEWNTILLAYEVIDYFTEQPEQIPEAITLYIIPSANPDGQYAVTGKEGRFEPEDLAANTVPGRFNGRGVDLNRNWDCQWSETAFWSSQTVNPGAGPFSESESRALRDFFVAVRPQAVIFYHSAADGVYPAGCPQLYPPARRLAEFYASAAGYLLFDSFTHYDVTGDAGSWLATQGIPAITVELADHENLEWDKNKRGILEVLENLDSLSPKGLVTPNALLPDD